MKIQILHTVDIDPEAWDLNYGTGPDLHAIRQDVRRYLAGLMEDQIDVIGVRAATATTTKGTP